MTCVVKRILTDICIDIWHTGYSIIPETSCEYRIFYSSLLLPQHQYPIPVVKVTLMFT